MPARLPLTLTDADRTELCAIRDRDPLPYLRERAAALLKIAAGRESTRAVAAHGLLRPRRHETVARWVHRYQSAGVAGLRVHPGRGRKPAFFPLTRAAAVRLVTAQIRRSPRLSGLPRSRWRFADLGLVIPWLQNRDRGRIRHIVRRLGLRLRRGRAYLHSPDLAYDAKLRRITGAQMVARYDPAHTVLLYADEFTYYRRPTLAAGLAPCGSDQPRARFGRGFNTKRRIACCLNAMTGQLSCWQRARFDHATLSRFYRAVAAEYPAAERIYLVHDNWKVHTHPALLAELTTGPILPLLLPTYAPWTNPVEQVWRYLHADVLHLHDLADDWPTLVATVTTWLTQWQLPSVTLLHRVGLWPD